MKSKTAAKIRILGNFYRGNYYKNYTNKSIDALDYKIMKIIERTSVIKNIYFEYDTSPNDPLLRFFSYVDSDNLSSQHHAQFIPINLALTSINQAIRESTAPDKVKITVDEKDDYFVRKKSIKQKVLTDLVNPSADQLINYLLSLWDYESTVVESKVCIILYFCNKKILTLGFSSKHFMRNNFSFVIVNYESEGAARYIKDWNETESYIKELNLKYKLLISNGDSLNEIKDNKQNKINRSVCR